ncbi:piggyBac transposable element-derived protein 4-like [Prorops nasuta]|uniref:piggyBac transposable element-derived protein 4-like n=1 Tax=Prorops nasuta TaxID=863751 RepID=UPI0034CD3F76
MRRSVRLAAQLAAAEMQNACTSDEEISNASDVECDEDITIEQSDSCSEQSISESEWPTTSKPKRGRPSLLRAKNCTWSVTPVSSTTMSKNLRNSIDRESIIPSPKEAALQIKSPLEAWSLLMSENIIDKIVKFTNIELLQYTAANNVSDHIVIKTIDKIEIKAFFGLLYYSGLFKVNRTDIEDLWSVHSLSLFRATMTYRRFKIILRCIRFDDKETRKERLQNDKFAHIRECWDMFISNCKNYYEPGKNVTIDEQLLSFRGRCSFKIYIPSKPDRYGLKIVSIHDAETHYMFDALPYTGTVVNKEPTESVPAYFVRKLCESISGSNRNITADNWFTSLPIVEKLSDSNLTYVGTIRKNKQEIPESFKRAPADNSDAQFAFRKNMTLLSYYPKKKNKKVVLLLSSLHKDRGIDAETNKPNIVVFYNKTKGGVDSFDKKCHDYSVARRTQRWPLRFMYGMLDQCNVNAHILHNFCENNSMLSRKKFVLELAMSLVKPLLTLRLTLPTLRISVRNLIEQFIPNEERFENQLIEDELPTNLHEKPKRCQLCPYSSDRKSRAFCIRCRKTMCKEHVAKICTICEKK